MSKPLSLATHAQDTGGGVTPPVVLPRWIIREAKYNRFRIEDTFLGQQVGGIFHTEQDAKWYIDGLLDRTQRLAGMSEMAVRE